MRTPLSQGGLDGLCGIYSIVNALGLLFPSSMNADASDHIFKVIVKACVSIWPDILSDGTTEHDIRAMLIAAQTHLKGEFSWEQPFQHKKFLDFHEFKRELEWRIAGDNCFAIVGISKPWSHWTCVHRFTKHEIIMTDSCHVKQIHLSGCGLAGDGTEFEFDFRQTFTIMKDVK